MASNSTNPPLSLLKTIEQAALQLAGQELSVVEQAGLSALVGLMSELNSKITAALPTPPTVS